MKRLLFPISFCLAAISLIACQASQTEEPVSASNIENAAAIEVKARVVRLRLSAPVSEPRACIIPIRVENGLEADTNVTMIGFGLRGPGDDAKGNMFAPQAAAGQFSEARVIVEGQSCGAYDTLSIPEIRCTSGEENCADKVELIDGGGLRFAKTG